VKVAATAESINVSSQCAHKWRRRFQVKAWHGWRIAPVDPSRVRSRLQLGSSVGSWRCARPASSVRADRC